MRPMRALVCWFALLLPACPLWCAEAVTIEVWPGPPPGDEHFRPPATLPAQKNDGITRIPVVTSPTLTLFRPAPERANGAVVIVCPGGAYNILAWDLEGTEVAAWLNSIGVTAVVLKYRVPRRDPAAPQAAPLQDAQRALRLVRSHASEWAIDPQRVGILGFSAGGNLAVMAATHWDDTTYPKRDDVDQLSCRPDFTVPIYPAYLGDEKKAGPLSPLVRVTGETPPMFIAVTHDDALRGINAASLYVELKKANVGAELHIFTKGGHGYGLRPSANAVSHWPQHCEAWLRAAGFLDRTSK